MRFKALLSAIVAAALVSGIALAQQTLYFQGAQTPGQLALISFGGAGGVPYVAQNGSANVATTTSCRLFATGNVPTGLTATASLTAQTPVITEVYYAEAYVPAPCNATGVAVYNSGTLSGNLKVGLYNSTGALVATSASTAAAGTTVYQLVPFTAAAVVNPGTYYLATFYDNTTIRPNTWTNGSFVAAKLTGQTYATGFPASLGTLATTFTTALGPVASLY